MSELTDVDFEALNKRYNALIAEYIASVEQHLDLAPGTLADIKHDSDYLKVLKMHATVEPLLNQLLEKSVTGALKHPKVNFPGGDALAAVVDNLNLERKVQLAKDCELISAQQAAFIMMLSRVRNHYAHSIKNMHLSIRQVAAKISPKDDGVSVQCVLFGVSKEGAKTKIGQVALALLSSNIFNMFGNLIGTVVVGINPPPSTPLLSKFLGMTDDPA